MVEFPLALLEEAYAHESGERLKWQKDHSLEVNEMHEWVAQYEGARRSGRIEYRFDTRYACALSNNLPLLSSPLEIHLGPSNASIDGSYSSHLTRDGLLGVQTALSAMWQPSGGQYVALDSSPICQGFISTLYPANKK